MPCFNMSIITHVNEGVNEYVAHIKLLNNKSSMQRDKGGTEQREGQTEQLCNTWKIVRLCWLLKENHSYAYLRLFVIVKRRKTGNVCGVWVCLRCQISPIINELGELECKVCAQDGWEWELLKGKRRDWRQERDEVDRVTKDMMNNLLQTMNMWQ